jgi:hypothetical protein
MDAQVNKIIAVEGYEQELNNELYRKPTRSNRPRGIYWSKRSDATPHLFNSEIHSQCTRSACPTRQSGTPVHGRTAREPEHGKSLTMLRS